MRNLEARCKNIHPFNSTHRHYFPSTVAPKIDRKNLQKRKIKVGLDLRFEADVTGEPEPTITWTFKEQTQKSSGRVTIENKEYHTSFVLIKVTREDSGKYTVTAKNDSGTDTVDIEVQVVSKPAKPKGPLKVRGLIVVFVIYGTRFIMPLLLGWYISIYFLFF